MAYLKGNTYVDGDLYIEGSLKVKRIVDNKGLNLPYLDEDFIPGGHASQLNKLVKFTTTDGGVYSSHVMESLKGDTVTFDFIKENSNIINFNNDNIPFVISGASQINIDTHVSDITVKAPNRTTGSQRGFLVALVKQSSTILNNKGQAISPPATKVYTDISGVKYVPWVKKPVTEDFKNIPWFIPERFCFVEDLEDIV